ncbi:MAG: TSUP family transporter [Campylobacter sp.]|nr:TSUP family transporter [Campylobacter sp.]
MEFEIWQFGIFFIAAFMGGFIDAIAGGGGLICLPVLLNMGVPVHIALATNKLQGSFGSFTAALNFVLKGLVDLRDIVSGIVFTFIGAVLGTYLVSIMDAGFLEYLIPVFLTIIFIYTLFSPNLGEVERNPLLKSKPFYLLFGLLLGFYDGFFGPGTGSFWTIALIAILGLGLKNAIAQTKVFNFVSNIVSLAVFLMVGEVYLVVGLVMAVGQVLGGYMGSNMVVKKDVKFIKNIFLAVVGFIILNLIYKYILSQI